MLKNKIFKILAAIAIIATITTAQTSAVWNGTANTSWYNALQNEFTINTAEQLAGLAELVNDGNDFSGKTIKLGANIMLNDTTNWRNWINDAPIREWVPITGIFDTTSWINDGEPDNAEDYLTAFNGTFDGNGRVVSGIYISAADYSIGLFGFLAKDGTIKNLGVVASYIIGKWDIGGLVGANWGGTITNSYSTGNVRGDGGIGGLVGTNWGGTINNSYSTGDVQGVGNGSLFGGLAGINYEGTISGSYSTGNVLGHYYVGGLVGANWHEDGNVSIIINSYSTGNVQGDWYVGGLTSSGGKIINSYSTGNVKGNGGVGGLIGLLDGDEYIINSYFDSQTSGQSGSMGRTTAQMKQQSTFIGWDFENVWTISPTKNNGYPYLLALGDNPITSITTEKIGNKKSTPFAFAGIKNGQINLRLQAGNYTAELYNLQGRLIGKTEINATNGINATGLRTDNLSRGVFILNVKQAGNSVLRQKISIK